MSISTPDIKASSIQAYESEIIPVADLTEKLPILGSLAVDEGTLIPHYGNGTNWLPFSTGSAGVSLVNSGTGLTGGPITTTGTLSLANTAVTPGSYTLMSGTIDAQGRLTAAASGTAVTSVSAGTGLTGGPITTTGTLSIANTAVTPGSYTAPTVNISATGQITSATSNAILATLGTSATSLQVGSSASTGAFTNALAVGNNSTAGTNNAIIIGDLSSGGGIVIGTQSSAPTAVPNNYSIVIGHNVNPPSTDESIYVLTGLSKTNALTLPATSEQNAMVCPFPSYQAPVIPRAQIYNAYLGSGMMFDGANGDFWNNSIVGCGASVCGHENATIGSNLNTHGDQNAAVGSGATVGNWGDVTFTSECAVVGYNSAALNNRICILGANCYATNASSICIGRGARDNTLGWQAGTLNLATATAVTAAAAGPSDAYLTIAINGTTYKLLLHT